MNYLLQIRGFWMQHHQHTFSPTEVALYFYLLEAANLCGWAKVLKRSNAKVQADLGISYRVMRAARSKLIQAGLIEADSQNGIAIVAYRLVAFRKCNTGLCLATSYSADTSIHLSNREQSEAAGSSSEHPLPALPFSSPSFLRLWERLLQPPAWQAKSASSIATVLQLLRVCKENEATSIVQRYITENEQPGNFYGSKEKQQQQKKSKKQEYEHATLFIGNQNYGEPTI